MQWVTPNIVIINVHTKFKNSIKKGREGEYPLSYCPPPLTLGTHGHGDNSNLNPLFLFSSHFNILQLQQRQQSQSDQTSIGLYNCWAYLWPESRVTRTEDTLIKCYEGADPIPNARDVRIIVGGQGGTESCKTHLDNFQFPLPILLVSQSCLRGIIKLIKLATGDLLVTWGL